MADPDLLAVAEHHEVITVIEGVRHRFSPSSTGWSYGGRSPRSRACAADQTLFPLSASDTRPGLTLSCLPISACERCGSARFIARILSRSSSVIGTEVVGDRDGRRMW